jgi:CheY-like chemotaxis protein
MQKNILIIEDDNASLMLIEDLLTAKSYTVSGTAYPSEALKRLPSFNPELIITDINLPEMTGFELQRQIKNIDQYKNTPIIALTAIAIQDENKESLKNDFDYHLTKPLCISTLLSTVQTIFKKTN